MAGYLLVSGIDVPSSSSGSVGWPVSRTALFGRCGATVPRARFSRRGIVVHGVAEGAPYVTLEYRPLLHGISAGVRGGLARAPHHTLRA